MVLVLLVVLVGAGDMRDSILLVLLVVLVLAVVVVMNVAVTVTMIVTVTVVLVKGARGLLLVRLVGQHAVVGLRLAYQLVGILELL